MAWNDGLDPASPAHAIAADVSTSIRVMAGPGTGKSFALKRRVARLLEAGVRPAGILPVTFTNVAAEDLQRELRQVGVQGCEDIRGSTLHSLGMRILSRAGVIHATGRHPRPLNEFELEPLYSDLASAFGGKRALKRLISAYEAAWARLQHEQPGHAPTSEDQRLEAALIGWLRFHEGMLIGEIVPQLYRYLRQNPAADERAQYTHILVDEYQDLNKAEQGLIDLLADSAEVCVVGDDDQSLYSFKHAHPDGIRTYHETHAGTTDHAVSECRRCPTTVVAMANALIAHNQDRTARQLTPMNANGPGDVRILQYASFGAEVTGIAEIVRDIIAQGRRPEDILILAQRRFIGNSIQAALRSRRIPVRSYYQEGDLESVGAQDKFALLKLLVNQDDRIALRWLLGYGSADFRAGAYARIRQRCEQTGETPWNVLAQLAAGTLSIPYTGKLIQRFREIGSALAPLQAASNDLDALIQAWVPQQNSELDNFRALVATARAEAQNPEELRDAIIAAVASPQIPPDITQVRIMSLHKSKGLSSPVVIIAGCIEGLLPPRPDADVSLERQQADLEEQRRLFYVGLTRVKAEVGSNLQGTLILTSSLKMGLAEARSSGIEPAQVSGQIVNIHASRFLAELGPSAPDPQRG
jgi:DNA helicase-2/ATP-dependent DNA helicase PcrA